jgi:hypothetical protein
MTLPRKHMVVQKKYNRFTKVWSISHTTKCNLTISPYLNNCHNNNIPAKDCWRKELCMMHSLEGFWSSRKEAQFRMDCIGQGYDQKVKARCH